MKTFFVAVLAAVSIGLLLPSYVSAQQSLYGMPARMKDLTSLGLLEGGDLDSAQKTEVLLMWLAAERRTPSATIQGLGGGPIDSNYIQGEIVRALASWGDPTALAWIAASPTLKDKALGDFMKLALGMMGDQAQVPALEKILLNNPNPDLRAIAASDLGGLCSTPSIPALELACKDSFSLTFASETPSDANGGKVTAYYPVRQAAEEALRNLKTPAMLAKEKKYNELSVARLVEAKKHPPVAPLTPEHFVMLANGDQK